MQITECRWCGMMHGPQCPTVKAFEYYPDGSVKRVEFKTAAGYPQQAVSVPSVSTPDASPPVVWPQIVWVWGSGPTTTEAASALLPREPDLFDPCGR